MLKAEVLAAPGSTIDAATGLPTRVVHVPSGVVLRLIPSGEFTMGTPGDTKLQRPHRRVIRKPFYIAETETTIAEFRRFADATGYVTDAERGRPELTDERLVERNVGSFASVEGGEREWHTGASWRNPFPNFPSFATLDHHPVTQVSWNDAQAFCKHFGFALPTEAQWEYAARAGSTTKFPWGEDATIATKHANVADAAKARRFPSTNNAFPGGGDDGAYFIAPVASYEPNAWGLYDMIGNPEEWCQDAYSRVVVDGADETAGAADLAKPASAGKVMRGGSWFSGSDHANSSMRTSMMAFSRRDFIGFRVAMDVDERTEALRSSSPMK